ncbi:MAG: hypothetical protein ACRDNM_00865 [Gaiellaceae bacterium]
MDRWLSQVAETARKREETAKAFDRADRSFRAAIVAAHKQGLSLRAIRDAAGGAFSHEHIRRIAAAAARKGGK